MRLGICGSIKHDSPAEWAGKQYDWGLRAVYFPCDYRTDDKLIDRYVDACRDHDLVIAEVGAWRNPLTRDPGERAANIEYCRRQLALAEYVKAGCCVNIAGTTGEIWDGGYAENYSAESWASIVETTRAIIDAVKPVHTFYTLEPMPWMYPDSPANYLKLLKEIDRPGFAVHLDVVNMISSPERYFFNTRFIQECFQLLGKYIKSCHAKDVRLERFLTFNLKEVPCGEGALDLPAYAQLATQTDPDMPFLIEHLHSEEEYRTAIRYVQNLLRESD